MKLNLDFSVYLKEALVLLVELSSLESKKLSNIFTESPFAFVTFKLCVRKLLQVQEV